MDHVCYDLRDGRLSRDEAIKLVKKYDGKCSDMYIEKFCNYIDISQKEFWSTVEKFRSDIWSKKNGTWINKLHEQLEK